jgi:hypothetical protein
MELAISAAVAVAAPSAPDEWMLIESSNWKVAGFNDQAKLWVNYLKSRG